MRVRDALGDEVGGPGAAFRVVRPVEHERRDTDGAKNIDDVGLHPQAYPVDRGGRAEREAVLPDEEIEFLVVLDDERIDVTSVLLEEVALSPALSAFANPVQPLVLGRTPRVRIRAIALGNGTARIRRSIRSG